MHKNSPFLIILGILLVAGGVVLYERHKTALLDQNKTPAINQPQPDEDKEVINPKINPETGWKIFEHPYVPITFEYPPGFKLRSKMINNQTYLSLVFKDPNYFMQISIPPPEKGTEGAKAVSSVPILLGEDKFNIDIFEYFSGDRDPFFLAATPYEEENRFLKVLGYPVLHVGGFYAEIQCVANKCSPEEAKNILQQTVSSIRLAPDPTDPFIRVERKFDTNEFAIDKNIGWRIFKDPEYPLSFLFPPEFSKGSMMVSKRRSDGKISYSNVGFENDNYRLVFSLPPPEKGAEGAKIIGSIPLALGDEEFTLNVFDYFSEENPFFFITTSYEEETKFLELLNYPAPNVGGLYVDIQCISEVCSSEEAKNILQQTVSSIRLASDPR